MVEAGVSLTFGDVGIMFTIMGIVVTGSVAVVRMILKAELAELKIVFASQYADKRSVEASINRINERLSRLESAD